MNAASQPPPIPNTPTSTGFRLANWHRNGKPCLLTVILAIMGLLNLFQPWEADMRGSGYTATHREGDEIVRRQYGGTTAIGGGNAFTNGAGWIPLAGFAGVLWVCGLPRRSLGGRRWLPFCAGIIIFACVVDEFRSQRNEREKWLSGFYSRPVVTESAAIQWVIISSIGMILSGALFARRKIETEKTAANQPPPLP